MSVGIRTAMAAKKIRFDEEAISEILVAADSKSDSGAEASDVDESEEEQQASAQEEEPQAGTSGAGLPNWGPPQGRHIIVHPFVGPAKGVRLHTSTKTVRRCLC
jgi:hypothetical protein